MNQNLVEYEKLIDSKKLPYHIGIIMDGNGRWAKERGRPRLIGHRAGVETLREIIRSSSDIGIKILTIYAFSTENWKRPKLEIDGLMKLLVEYFSKEIKELNDNNVKINTIGNINQLPEKAKKAILKSIERTKENSGLILNIALNYGGRKEIVNGIKLLYNDINSNKLTFDEINEDIFSQYLYTKGMSDPDLIIRTSGEIRLSNFLTWQSAYSELWFTDVYWPDFSRENLFEAIYEFQNRKRRFGGI